MLKIVLGLIVGIVAAFAILMGIEQLAHMIFPGVDVSRPGVSIPVGMQIFVIVAYFIATLAGAVIGGRIADRRWVAWAVALVVTASAVASIFVPGVNQPLLMDIAGVIAPLLAGFVASRMVPDRTVHTDGALGDAAL